MDRRQTGVRVWRSAVRSQSRLLIGFGGIAGLTAQVRLGWGLVVEVLSQQRRGFGMIGMERLIKITCGYRARFEAQRTVHAKYLGEASDGDQKP